MIDVWENKITHYTEESPEQLLGSPYNWRRHSGLQQNAMVALLEELGWIAPIICNSTTGHIVDGHMRVEVSLRHGIERLPVAWVTLSEEDERKAILMFDPITSMAGKDTEALDSLIDEVTVTDDALVKMLEGLVRKEDTNSQETTLYGQEEDTREKSIECPHCHTWFTLY